MRTSDRVFPRVDGFWKIKIINLCVLLPFEFNHGYVNYFWYVI